MNYELELNPRDVLYFRDGRPLGGSADGGGAWWPHPALLHSALLAAMHEHFGACLEEWEGRHRNYTSAEQRKQKSRKVRFQLGGLKSYGPFPKQDGEILVSTPADLLARGGVASPIQPSPRGGASNLPRPLKYPVGSLAGATKDKPGEWMPLSELDRYLKGDTEKLRTVSSDELFLSEARPGIAVDTASRAAADKKFYSAEYLRLCAGVTMTAVASCEARNREGTLDVLARLFPEEGIRRDIIFGGQRGMVQLEGRRAKEGPVESEQPGSFPGNRIKFVLLSPALFRNGWIPGWTDSQDGRVKLREKGHDGDVDARLVAACIPKPQAISGWDSGGNVPKATRMLAPAGSVYYFECGSEEAALALCRCLHGRVRSDDLGEQGFGLGVCGRWDFTQLSRLDPENITDEQQKG